MHQYLHFTLGYRKKNVVTLFNYSCIDQ